MDEIRFIDLFSGVAGFRRGLEKAGGFRCVWSNDWNKYANQVYTKHFGTENHHSGDIREIDPKEIPDFDLLCAGFPCPSWSVAGKRKGFEDERGEIFWEIIRIVHAKKPKYLLLENVKGLLSHDKGHSFEVICEAICSEGYAVDFTVLNSKYFGVPQNRERVFILAVRLDMVDESLII